MKKKMWMMTTVWTAVAAMFLIAHATGWAMEKTETPSFTPHQFRFNQLLGPERVMDSNPGAAGVRGNSVPNLQRWNAILLQTSHNALRQQGAGTSPDGEIVSQKRQKVESQIGRIQQ